MIKIEKMTDCQAKIYPAELTAYRHLTTLSSGAYYHPDDPGQIYDLSIMVSDNNPQSYANIEVWLTSTKGNTLSLGIGGVTPGGEWNYEVIRKLIRAKAEGRDQ